MAVVTVTATGAVEARGRHHRVRPGFTRSFMPHRPVPHAARANFGSSVGATNFGAMVVDANSGRTLYAANPDAPRHPASITKVMTLFLLFEELERGRLRLDSPLTVSAHAAAQAPTKLGLRPGSTIAVENAIKAIVTKSANDMAVTVAENIAGDEGSFAEAMTAKAHQLGMEHTFYHNASGLPDMRQITTARDLTILGRAISERFPRYYHYFSTPSFTYAGSFMPNHNHLLGRVEGMDGIKTGYTAASGFNLLTSVKRDGRHIVAVVLGGRTAASRDRVMQALIETNIEEASATPSTAVADASPVEEPARTPRERAVEAPVDRQPPRRPADLAQEQPDDAGPRPEADVSFSAGERMAAADAPSEDAEGPVEHDPPRGPSLIAPNLALPTPPVVARRAPPAPALTFRSVPAALPVERAAATPASRVADAAPTPSPRPVKLASLDVRDDAARRGDGKVRPAFISGLPKTVSAPLPPVPLAATERRRLAADGSTSHRGTSDGATPSATATPSSLRWVTGAQPVRHGPSAAETRGPAGRDRSDPPSTGSIAPADGRVATAAAGPAAAAVSRSGWVIQIGATADIAEANALLTRAKQQGRGVLASARPFTQKVQKGDATLYRARFAGLEPAEAESACRTLKRSGFACFATHD